MAHDEPLEQKLAENPEPKPAEKELTLSINKQTIINIVLAINFGLLIVYGWQIIGIKKVLNDGGGAAASAQKVAAAPTPSPAPAAAPTPPPVNADNIREVTKEDHIRGNVDAKVVLIEYSDFECPFCKRFHPTMKQIVNEYDAADVAWVYRQFPLDQLHRKARKEAIATECAAALGGNDKFWEYTDKIFEITPSNDGLDLALLPQIAEDIGLDRAAFEECINSTRFDQHVQEDVQDAQAAGGTGTPYTVVIGPDGTVYPVSGAQPYSAVKAVIDLALSAG